eukprot:TRINITY_DN55360_c0_g1_i1.p1 TRINITY_DN55360_c0_g1~~TRINITY_DN55360_c0_g1_i1.p1  ORF type:complete len:486 (+),score=76.26 TRINITY_DN55360_c0_g1_i1:47-1504(+)
MGRTLLFAATVWHCFVAAHRVQISLQKSSLESDESLVSAACLTASGLPVELPYPFTLVIQVTNKQEVVAKMGGTWFGWAMDYVVSDATFMSKMAGKLSTMMPVKLKEQGLEVSAGSAEFPAATKLKLPMRITSLNLKHLLTKAKGERFANTVLSLKGIFKDLGQPEKYPEIEAKMTRSVLSGFLAKLPEILQEKLAEEHIKAIVSVEPTPSKEEEPLPTLIPAPASRHIFSIEFLDREVIIAAARAEKGAVAAGAVQHMPSGKFVDLVAQKLLAMPQSIQEKLAAKGMDGALGISAVAEPQDHPKDAMWLVMDIDSSNSLPAILSMQPALARLFQAFDILRDEGLEQMGIMKENVGNQVIGKFVEGITDALPTQLTEKLGARVNRVSAPYYDLLKQKQQLGRCCGVEADDEEPPKIFFVPHDLLKRSAVCPRIRLDGLEACAMSFPPRPFAHRHMHIEQTHHRALTACFQDVSGALASELAGACQ